MNVHKALLNERDRPLTGGIWFSRLPADIQHQMLELGRERRLAAGTFLFNQGEPPSGLHGIITGQLHVIGTARTGHDLLMAIHRPGDWVGFLTCIDGLPHPLSGRAATDMTVLTLSPAKITSIFERDVATFKFLLEPELRVGRSNYHWLIEMLVRPSLQRVAARLLQLSRWAHGSSAHPSAPIEHVNQEELASACNLSRQTMNNALRDLEGKGFIRVGYGHIDILDGQAMHLFITSDPEKLPEL